MSGVRESDMIRRVLIVVAALGFASTCALGGAYVFKRVVAPEYVRYGWSLFRVPAGEWSLGYGTMVSVVSPFDIRIIVASAECSPCGMIVNRESDHDPSCSTLWIRGFVEYRPPNYNWRFSLPGFGVSSAGAVRPVFRFRLNLGYPIVFFGVPLVIAARRGWRKRDRRRRGLCLGCGYDLRGLPEPRCPECGKSCAEQTPSKRGAEIGAQGR